MQIKVERCHCAECLGAKWKATIIDNGVEIDNTGGYDNKQAATQAGQELLSEYQLN